MIPVNFYHFKDLTEDQISLFMADLNQSLFCLAKFQAHILKLFWELSFPHPRLDLPDQEIPASSLKFTMESRESKMQKTDFFSFLAFPRLWIITIFSFFLSFSHTF